MNIVASQVGIDVSSQELVVSVQGAAPFKVPNTASGVQDLVARVPAGAAVHIECTGGHERLVARTLRRLDIEVRLHNPLRTRRLQEGIGAKAKTDPIDARMLSSCGNLLPHRPAKASEREDLADFSRAIDAVKETIAEYRRRLGMPELDADAAAAYQALIRVLTAQAKSLEVKFLRRVKSSSYREQHALAQSVPGVGPVTARACICELPEDFLSQRPGCISSYAGLAPIDNSSGARDLHKSIRRGCSRLKKALYMPALACVRAQPWAKDLYRRLRAKGRAHQQAIVAVMRRLLVRIVSVLKRGTPWQGEPPKLLTT